MHLRNAQLSPQYWVGGGAGVGHIVFAVRFMMNLCRARWFTVQDESVSGSVPE